MWGTLLFFSFFHFLQQPNRIWNKLINHDTAAESKNWGWVESFTGYTKYDQIRSNELMSIEIARGCRFACLFCAWPLIGKKDIAKYIKGSDALYKELLDNYTKWGITDYWIADDTLNDSTEKLQYMAEVIKLLPFKPNFRCYIRIDLIYKGSKLNNDNCIINIPCNVCDSSGCKHAIKKCSAWALFFFIYYFNIFWTKGRYKITIYKC